MKRFLVNCRNHRGRTRDVAITAASEAEAIGYLKKKGFTDCVVRGAAPGKAADDATTAVPVLPDPEVPAPPDARARSFSHRAPPRRAKTSGGDEERPSPRDVETDREADAPAEDSPWWATTRGVASRGWTATRTAAARAWSWSRAICTKGWTRTTAFVRRKLKRDRADG